MTHGSCDELVTAYLEFLAYYGGFLTALKAKEVGSALDEATGPQFLMAAAHLWGAGSRLLDALGSNLYRELKDTPVANVYEPDKREAANGARADLELDAARFLDSKSETSLQIYQSACTYMHGVCTDLCLYGISIASIGAYGVAAQYTEGTEMDVPKQIARVHESLSILGSILTIYGIPLGSMLIAAEESMAAAETEKLP